MTTTTTIPPITEYYDRELAKKHLSTFNSDLSVDFMRQAALYAYWAAKLVQAESQYDRLQDTLRLMEAKLDRVVRDDAAKAGTKVTEAQVAKTVALDSRVITMGQRVREAKEQVGYLKSTCIAFAQRKDMLQQMGFAKSKEEAAAGMHVRSSAQSNHNARLERMSHARLDDDLGAEEG